MKRIKLYFFVFSLLFTSSLLAQTVEINGKIIANNDEVEGIHVINKTESQYTITDSNGEFRIPAKLHDSIIFVAIKYNYKAVIITSDVLKSKNLVVNLTELINQLDEVVIGKVLTGNLLSDITNSDAKRGINFYDLGIPGYTGRPFTQSERRLKEASSLDPYLGGSLGGLGIGFSINPIINAISGRTKMLKNRVRLERFDTCLDRIKSNLSKTLFKYNELDEALRNEFFYYCSEDDQFSNLCAVNNDIRTLLFLQEKLKTFKSRIEKD